MYVYESVELPNSARLHHHIYSASFSTRLSPSGQEALWSLTSQWVWPKGDTRAQREGTPVSLSVYLSGFPLQKLPLLKPTVAVCWPSVYNFLFKLSLLLAFQA